MGDDSWQRQSTQQNNIKKKKKKKKEEEEEEEKKKKDKDVHRHDGRTLRMAIEAKEREEAFAIITRQKEGSQQNEHKRTTECGRERTGPV